MTLLDLGRVLDVTNIQNPASNTYNFSALDGECIRTLLQIVERAGTYTKAGLSRVFTGHVYILATNETTCDIYM